MRGQIQKLRRSNSPKGERIVAEILKRNHIKFRARIRLGRYEIDFLCGRVAVEVDGSIHTQTNREKDTALFNSGYVPVHISSKGKISQELENELIFLIRKNNV